MPLPPPRTARAAMLRFRLVVWLLMPGTAAVIAWVLFEMTRDNSVLLAMPQGEAIAATIALLAFAASATTGYLQVASYRSRVLVQRAAAFSITVATCAYLLVYALQFPIVPWPVASVICAAAAIPLFRLASGIIGRDARDVLATLSKAPSSLREADRMARDCEALLARGKLKPERRRLAELNRSRALIARSILDDQTDGLVLATDSLRGLLADPPQFWHLFLSVADEQVNAMRLKALKHGDLFGYRAALDIMMQVAQRMPPDAAAPALAWDQFADYHRILAERALTREQFVSHIDDAVAALRSAIGAVPATRGDLLPQLYAKLGDRLAWRRGDPADLEEGIALCREGQRLAGRSRKARMIPDLLLAGLLLERVNLRPQRDAAVEADLGEAERLLRSLIRRATADHRWVARVTLARVRSAWSTVLDTDEARKQAALAWREAARHAVDVSVTATMQIATEWVDWATGTEQPQWCAEAYAYLMAMVPRAGANRYLAKEKERLLARVDVGAEESGYWMAYAGRVQDAAVALDLGRAVTISEVLSRDRLDLPAALTRAGRPDLLARYRAAAARLGHAQQPAMGADANLDAQRAWAEYDRVSREVAAVDGTHQIVAPVVYQDIAAAAVHGPLVYLAAAQRGGYAVIVTAGREPSWLPLPNLSRPRVRDHAQTWLATDPHSVSTTLRWLWENGIAELAEHLPAGADVTLVPAGVLGLLPIHAAGGPRSPGDSPIYLSDRVTVRYAPNARTLLHAFQRAEHCAPTDLTLLVVDAPDADRHRRLVHARQEAVGIADRWRATGLASTHLPDATRDTVLLSLGRHQVWHFACHGDATPDEILQSGLLLGDGRLTLADLLSVPSSPRRLAVLSACRTHLSSHELPNEVIGLPGGMLQIGLAGVVASHWSVDDQATAFLMTSFYRHWQDHRLPPAVALAAAQRWLRHATHDELLAARPDLRPRSSRDLEPAEAAIHDPARPYHHPYYWAPFALTGA